MNYIGFVNGIDVINNSTNSIRCLAFINKKEPPSDYIQVETDTHQLQSTLELAALMKKKVEISYEVISNVKVLNRVRILDR